MADLKSAKDRKLLELVIRSVSQKHWIGETVRLELTIAAKNRVTTISVASQSHASEEECVEDIIRELEKLYSYLNLE